MKKMTITEKAYLDAAADEVSRQMEQNPGIPIPVDPEVADHMGFGLEDAISYEDALEAAQPFNVEDE